jgi:hypothetical protein
VCCLQLPCVALSTANYFVEYHVSENELFKLCIKDSRAVLFPYANELLIGKLYDANVCKEAVKVLAPQK